ncbi:hypothetical protein C8J57DRAFT_1372070 [Mycena rebaudengoi]|nr:hypothetical protein C8J57DRAFT_1376489 [Mycena rebaudengoi]KAJ7239730.1 hypothetical protein C8J57DRAFT_1372493 [Mycena rebaudengoi]KAJ7240090.1 hypothetical protein C8J57DRAFT_1372070 [Mycena rebaudengoi]
MGTLAIFLLLPPARIRSYFDCYYPRASFRREEYGPRGVRHAPTWCAVPYVIQGWAFGEKRARPRSMLGCVAHPSRVCRVRGDRLAGPTRVPTCCSRLRRVRIF